MLQELGEDTQFGQGYMFNFLACGGEWGITFATDELLESCETVSGG